jgi:hypothetical protein
VILRDKKKERFFFSTASETREKKQVKRRWTRSIKHIQACVSSSGSTEPSSTAMILEARSLGRASCWPTEGCAEGSAGTSWLKLCGLYDGHPPRGLPISALPPSSLFVPSRHTGPDSGDALFSSMGPRVVGSSQQLFPFFRFRFGEKEWWLQISSHKVGSYDVVVGPRMQPSCLQERDGSRFGPVFPGAGSWYLGQNSSRTWSSLQKKKSRTWSYSYPTP